ncbi:MAG: ATP-dependent DNA ligase [Bacteroidetes bacterium]|nr:MAG: ATP-dependent DNA ligase [Bacteroidota bacterium]
MQYFAQLVSRLDQTNKTNAKVAALVDFLAVATDMDKLWAVALFTGRRPRRTVKTSLLRAWTAELSGLPLWLVEESYHVVGDLAETMALLLPPPAEGQDNRTLSDWMTFLADLAPLEESEKAARLKAAWTVLSPAERFVFNKLITGGFRLGVSQKLLVRALARHHGLDPAAVTHRLMGDWTPNTTTYAALLFSEDVRDDISKPYPFFLAHPLEGEPEALGAPADWQAEWKWDGIRAQYIVRGGEAFLWSRGEELITDKFPELAPLAEAIPDGTVIDAELLPFRDGQPLSFQLLQTRIGRKRVSKKQLAQAPVVLMAYDLLEWAGEDIRPWPLSQRRAHLEGLVRETARPELRCSPRVEAVDWAGLAAQRARAREELAEGLMLKRRAAPYRVGRVRGDWWKWKVDPFSIDAVMIYAQRGHGRRANLYTDYTFAVWEGDQLVPFAKAYSGLTDAEIRQVDAWVKRHTRERFGPVRSVDPELVFEIGFEGINRSGRHKSGVALRFPRILRWRQDKVAAEADTLDQLKALLPPAVQDG